MALSGLLLLAGSASGYAQDCGRFLVPKVNLQERDTATDLAYLAFISAENFQSHKDNANSAPQPLTREELFRTNVHVGLDLPIARQLLQSSATYEDFAGKREQTYRQYQFDYARADLAKYYVQSLPEPLASQYAGCTNAVGIRARVAKADRDFVELVIGWRPPAGASAEAALAPPVIAGAALQGTMPTQLKFPGDLTLMFIRDLDKEFRIELKAADSTTTVFIPRSLDSEPVVDAATAQCASAAKVVRAAYRQVLERDIEPALLAQQAALLSNHTNSVRQLIESLVNSAQYTERFVHGKYGEDVLRGYYRHIFARDSDAKGLAFNASLLRTSGHAKVAIAFEESPEYRQRFGEWIVPGSPPRVKYCGN